MDLAKLESQFFQIHNTYFLVAELLKEVEDIFSQ